MTDRKVIAIDGLAGSGKSTIARLLSERLGFVHLSTGLIYRSAGYIALQAGLSLDRPELLVQELLKHKISLQLSGNSAVVSIDEKEMGEELHTPQVSEATSKCAQYREIRQALYRSQREAFSDKDIIVEGRDMGTIVFPDAALKIFITASAEVRVERRMRQLYGESEAFSTEQLAQMRGEMEREIRERDNRDQNRSEAPTVASKDSIIIDNSSKGLDPLISQIVSLAVERGLADKLS